MDEPTSLTQGPASSNLSYKLRWFAKALFSAYILSIVVEAFPFRILDANWRLNLANLLVDNATIPLIGLGMVHLAAYLDPANPAAQALRARISRLAVVASLGFLLILPLQLGTTIGLYADLSANRFQQLDQADRRLQDLASAIGRARTVEQLETTLLTLQGSALSPNDQTLPLSSLQNLLLKRVDEARKVIRERRRQMKAVPLDPALLIQRSVRVMLTSLMFALAYAAGAQRKNHEVSWLEEWQAVTLRHLENLVRSREERLAARFEQDEFRKEQERIAALESFRQHQLEDAEEHPSPPDSLSQSWKEAGTQTSDLSDLDYYSRIMPEALSTESGSTQPEEEIYPGPATENAPRIRPITLRNSVSSINQYLDRLAADNPEATPPDSPEKPSTQ